MEHNFNIDINLEISVECSECKRTLKIKRVIGEFGDIVVMAEPCVCTTNDENKE